MRIDILQEATRNILVATRCGRYHTFVDITDMFVEEEELTVVIKFIKNALGVSAWEDTCVNEETKEVRKVIMLDWDTILTLWCDDEEEYILPFN